MARYSEYSHDGIHDRLTLCAAPPIFYSHLDRMISGSSRSGAPLSLVAVSIPIHSSLDQILAIAHEIKKSMRKEDLCGRTGDFQFVVILAGNLANGEKLLERIRISANLEFTSEIVEWAFKETTLEFLYRLDLAVELPT